MQNQPRVTRDGGSAPGWRPGWSNAPQEAGCSIACDHYSSLPVVAVTAGAALVCALVGRHRPGIPQRMGRGVRVGDIGRDLGHGVRDPAHAESGTGRHPAKARRIAAGVAGSRKRAHHAGGGVRGDDERGGGGAARPQTQSGVSGALLALRQPAYDVLGASSCQISPDRPSMKLIPWASVSSVGQHRNHVVAPVVRRRGRCCSPASRRRRGGATRS